ncbi:hypothetical protein B566_EDAN017035 [Ephemera danica]|nr:hypothetical protein B566_EDAN017035 [Ephemera danica]
MVTISVQVLVILSVFLVTYASAPRRIIIVEEIEEGSYFRDGALRIATYVEPYSQTMLSSAKQRANVSKSSSVKASISGASASHRIIEDRRRLGRGSCELSALPQGEVGPALLRDFIEDRDYDFYERRRGAPPECAASVHGSGGEPPRENFSQQRPGGLPNRPYQGGVPNNWGSGRPPGNWDSQGRPPSNWNEGPPRYGPNQSPRPPPPYGPQFPPRDGPPQSPYRPPPGPYQQGPNRPGPGGAPWSNSAVGFYGPASPDFGPPPGGPRPGGGNDWGRPFGAGHREIGGYGSGRPNAGFPDDDECFSRVWSGQKLDNVMVRAASSPPTLGGCQLECLHARDFTCRSFSFRYGPSRGPGDTTCLLTDRPLGDLHPRNGLVTDPDFEFYERSSFMQGCQHLNQYPSSLPWNQQPGSYPEVNNQLPPLLAKPLPPRPYETGHQHHDSEYYLYGLMIELVTPNIGHLRDSRPVQLHWQLTRLHWMTAYLAAQILFDYGGRLVARYRTIKYKVEKPSNIACAVQNLPSIAVKKSGVHGHNCLLSELAQRDLRPDRDFVHESGDETSGWRLMAWDWSDPKCREPPSLGPPGGNSIAPWNPNRDKPESQWGGGSGGGTFGIYAGGSNSGSSGGYGGSSGGSGGTFGGGGGGSTSTYGGKL